MADVLIVIAAVVVPIALPTAYYHLRNRRRWRQHKRQNLQSAGLVWRA